MAARKPIVRHFIACEEVERSPDGHQYSLRNILYAIAPPAGDSYPRAHPQIHLFALLTDGEGQLPLALQIVVWEGTEERSIYTSEEVIIDFGTDPLKVSIWRVRLRNVPFERPGLYEFHLLYGGEIIAREPLLLRDSP